MNNAMWPKFPSRWSYFGDPSPKIFVRLEKIRNVLAENYQVRAVEIFSEFFLSSSFVKIFR